MRASTVCHCGGGSQFAATHCGGLRNCTCTSSKSSLHSSSIIGALEALLDREHPRSVQLDQWQPPGARRGAGLHGVPLYRLRRPLGVWPFISSASRRHGSSWRGAERSGAGLAAARARRRTVPPSALRSLGFVHRAFWRADSGDGSAEAYIGPALAALEARLGGGRVAYVSVGPASNFRARRWWHGFRGSALPESVPPIESYAPIAALAESRRVWKERHTGTPSALEECRLARRRYHPRVRLLAGCSRGTRGHRDPAMAVVRAGDGRSGCHARRPSTGGRRDLRRGRRLGPGDRPRKSAPRDSVCRPAARLHLPALVELSSRAGRDGRGSRSRRTIEAFRVRPSPCSSTTTSALI